MLVVEVNGAALCAILAEHSSPLRNIPFCLQDLAPATCALLTSY